MRKRSLTRSVPRRRRSISKSKPKSKFKSKSKSKFKFKSKSVEKGCFKSTKSKYLNRHGTSFHAQDCKNLVRMGNDSIYYVSKKDKNGIYKWKKIKASWNVPD